MNCAKCGSLLAPNSKFCLKCGHPVSLEPADKSMPHSGIEIHHNMPKPDIPKPGMPKPSMPKPGMPKPVAPSNASPRPSMPKPGISSKTSPQQGMPKPCMPRPTMPMPGRQTEANFVTAYYVILNFLTLQIIVCLYPFSHSLRHSSYKEI